MEKLLPCQICLKEESTKCKNCPMILCKEHLETHTHEMQEIQNSQPICVTCKAEFNSDIEAISICNSCSKYLCGVHRLAHEQFFHDIISLKMLEIKKMKPYNLYLNGINVNEKIITKRNTTIEELLGIASKYRVVLVKAPPFCGKTSLIMLISDLYKQKGKNVIEINISSSWKSYEDFQKAWYADTKIDWYYFIKNEENNYLVLIDESQYLYGFSDLWNDLKYNESKSIFLFFSTYGEQQVTHFSPFEFYNVVGLEYLLLRDMEFNELVSNFNRYTGITISEDIKEIIKSKTNLHVGLVKKTLDLIFDKFYKCPIENKIFLYLFSKEYYEEIFHTRAIPKFENLEMEEIELLKEVLLNKGLLNLSFKSDIISTDSKYQMLRKLEQYGFITQINGKNIRFASPLVERQFMIKLISSKLQRIRYDEIDFNNFLKQTLGSLNKNVLEQSFSTNSKDTLKEAAWSMEFYAIARMIIPYKNSISPEVGSEFNLKGEIDFIVNSNLWWGIELLVDNQQTKSHVERFLPQGKYYQLGLTEWKVLNFIPFTKKENFIHPNLWNIKFPSDFSYLQICYYDGSTEKIDLMITDSEY